MNIDDLINEKLKKLMESISGPGRIPVSVYRLQFNESFTFRDAASLVLYLSELGITDCYASPYFKARRGSQHGYDISDQNSLNPQVGSKEEYHDFVNQLGRYNMGQILDFVPNHMSIFDNPKWQDVLENGPSSIYARFFDIDWEPVKFELHQKVLLPILEDLYGIVLERGYITLVHDRGVFFIEYRNHRLPVGPETTTSILESALNRIREVISDSHLDFMELQSIITACKNLPERSELEPEKMAERHREKEIIKRRLRELCQRNARIKSAIEEFIKTVNGKAGDSKSFTLLHELLEKQAYRLSYWRVATEEINYRRFFDVNELVALRMEDPLVFKETHRFISELFGKGLINGIRIDHVDGLFDPVDYLHNVQKSCWIESILQQLKSDPHFSKIDPKTLKNILIQKFGEDSKGKTDADFRPVYIIVEKILGENENINRDWPVEGTTGYEFMAALNQIFVDNKNDRKLRDIYRRFTGSNARFNDIAYSCKNLVMRTTMSGEVNMLANHINKVSEKSWQFRDFTLNSLRDAIREVIACFPVYRTYINAFSESISENDKAVIQSAIGDAKRRNPAVSSAVFDFVRDTLLLRYPSGMEESGRNEQRLFVMRFQQFTGPVMAKGMEDTAFYIYNPLVSLNEVGSNPRKFGTAIREFHKQNILRQQYNPNSFNATSTHDSKRGEDVRARINVLSEIPGEWRSALVRWSRFNESKKFKLNGELVPDKNEEYLLYQTLIGTYPWDRMDETDLIDYKRRIHEYMLKAIKEAKVHTSWISPHTAYEEGVTSFVDVILNPSADNLFLADFKRLNQVVATCGRFNSLSQVVLKVFSPGVPDIYQGNELWAFNLTDPDNRVPVDLKLCVKIFHQLQEQAADSRKRKAVLQNLLNNSQDGRIKLYITWKSLNYRKHNSELFKGLYLPLICTGPKRDQLCVFAWRNGEKAIVVAVPRFLASLTRQAAISPLGKGVWDNTRIALSRKLNSKSYRNIFTDEIISIHEENSFTVTLSEVFKSFPVAVLESR